MIPDDVPRQTTVSSVYLQHVPSMTPFNLFPEEYGLVHRDVHIVTRSGRVAQPPPVDRTFAGTDGRYEIQREDDEILASYTPLRPAFPFGAYWSHPAHIETH